MKEIKTYTTENKTEIVTSVTGSVKTWERIYISSSKN